MSKHWQISAQLLTPGVQRWLQQPTAVSLLHRFDQVINLGDAAGTIISVVQPGIGPGPFSLVVDCKRPFPTSLTPQSPTSKTSTSLCIGPLQIDLRPAKLWPPRPNWGLVRQQQAAWEKMLPDLQTAVSQNQHRLNTGSPAHFARQFHTATDVLGAALAQSDAAGMETAVASLAGLGPGLTPAGDDFLLGMLLGLWATRPAVEVGEIADMVVKTAVSRTTQLSAAWLKAAAAGEATLPWHDLAKAMQSGFGWQQPFNQILDTGATSGIAALMGFSAATSSWFAGL